MVDQARVAALVERIRSELAALRRSASREDAELLAADDALAAIKYRLVVVLEAAIDVADHIIASEGLRPAQSFADSFASLAAGGWIGTELCESLQDAARFRNLLLHQYADVDDHVVIEIVRTRLGELDEFCVTIARRLS